MKPVAYSNVMARLVGILFNLVGIAFVGWSIYFVLHPDDPRRITGEGTDLLVMGAVMGAFAILVGTALVTVRPYRPDLGDSGFSRAGGTPLDAQKTRSWWTGEPRL